MSGKEYSGFDRLLIRAKDIAFLLIFIWGILAWFGGLYRLPNRVEASEGKISALESRESTREVRLMGMEKDIKYIADSMRRIENKFERK